MEYITLDDGNEIPILGLGTYKLRGKSGETAIRYALEVGYRHIDTASFYRNEKLVGKAVRTSDTPREEIFVTSKVWRSDLGTEITRRAFDETMKKLDLHFLDLYLIHWPGEKSDRQAAWEVMMDLKEEGRVKSIGVSNFDQAQLEEFNTAFGSYPVINQVKFSVFDYKSNLLDFCQDNRITLTAYTPLAKGSRLDHPLLQELAGKYNKTAAQIMLRWIIQHEVVCIPKSANPDSIKENSDIFDFSLMEDDMGRLDQL